MTTRRVTAPDGARWVVRRRWIPHREGRGVVSRFRNHSKRDAADLLDVPDIGDGAAAIAVVIGVIVLLAVMLVFGWPLILIGFDLVWLLLVGSFGLLGRIVLRRPWRVEATSDDERRNWHVQGFRAAGRERDEIVRRFRHGQNPLGATDAGMQH